MGVKILVIDDDQCDQKIITKCLDREGFCEVSCVSSGEDGVDFSRKNNPDIILVDTNLPGIDGFETCKKIKDIDGNHAKVVVMTGFIESVNAMKAREHGADDYCAKNSDCSQLIVAIKEMVKELE